MSIINLTALVVLFFIFFVACAVIAGGVKQCYHCGAILKKGLKYSKTRKNKVVCSYDCLEQEELLLKKKEGKL